MAPDYKGLNLRRDQIDQYLTSFIADNSLVLRSSEFLDNSKKKKRIIIGRIGIDDAIIDLHLNNDGTTTIQYKTGKNPELGILLAQYLHNTIDPGEFDSVNFSLKGISQQDIEPIFDELISYIDDNGNVEFECKVEQDEAIRKLIRISSIAHKDTITVTHFKTTNKLTIQGRPLFSYRRIIYLMAELLDLSGLQVVLSRREENTAVIVRTEVARDYLKTQLTESFDYLPNTIQSLLISGCCVKLAWVLIRNNVKVKLNL